MKHPKKYRQSHSDTPVPSQAYVNILRLTPT